MNSPYRPTHDQAQFIVRATENHILLIRALERVRHDLAKHVYETGQPGTWATDLDDYLAKTLSDACSLDDRKGL